MPSPTYANFYSVLVADLTLSMPGFQKLAQAWVGGGA